MQSIILIGHGSPKKDANRLGVVADMLHRALHPGCADGCVKAAYMEFAEPSIPDALDSEAKRGAKEIIIHPFFLNAGVHVTKDIPGMISDAESRHPGVKFVYTEPLGLHEKLIEVVIERIHGATFSGPEDIEKRSFEIISEEADLGGLPPEQLPIVKRVIHSTADFEFQKTLVFHPDAVRVGIKAIRAGMDILTDIEMVKTGINKRLLEKWGGKVICNINRSGVRSEGPGVKEHDTGNKTKAALGIETALKEKGNIGIIAVGNAPTALLKVIELLNNSSLLTPHSSLVTPHPSLVVGVPVGFVKALESKALLSAQKFPFITNLSRKGGTPVAVAIVNALLKMAAEE
jgi:precorrin-8X/cobalt-precorrin-8 methylmutase